MCKCCIGAWLSVAMETVCSSFPSGRKWNTLQIWKMEKSKYSHCLIQKEQKIYFINEYEGWLPAVRVAPWRKRFWPKPGSADSAAALSALPPQSPPDLHKSTQWTQNMWSVCCVDMVLISRSRNMTMCSSTTLFSMTKSRWWRDGNVIKHQLWLYQHVVLDKKKRQDLNVNCFLCAATVVSCAAHTMSGLHHQHTMSSHVF